MKSTPDDIRIFVHVGMPKCASSKLQLDLFGKSDEINFLGVVRDHDGEKNIKKTDKRLRNFFHFVRGKNDDKTAAIIVRSFLDRKKVNVISEEDFSTANMISIHEKARRLHSILPEAEIILVLRNPVDFLRSFHAFMVRGQHVTKTIDDWLRDELLDVENSFFLNSGKIKSIADAYQNTFSTKNVKLINFDDFRSDPENTFQDLAEYIGIKSKLDHQTKRNQGLPPAAIKIATTAPFLWKGRALLPKVLRRAVKSLLSKIPAQKAKIEQDVLQQLEEFYEEDIAFIHDNLKSDSQS